MAARSRYAEDELAAAIANGVTQYVVLGGRNPFSYSKARPGLRVFEADRCNEQPLSSVLQNMGFQAGEASCFSWLGVRLYETAQATMAALAFIGSLPPASSVVFDYAAERSSLDSTEPLAMDALASRVGPDGGTSRWCLDSGALHRMLRAAGFHQIQDLGPEQIDRLYSDGAAAGGFAHLVNARV